MTPKEGKRDNTAVERMHEVNGGLKVFNLYTGGNLPNTSAHTSHQVWMDRSSPDLPNTSRTPLHTAREPTLQILWVGVRTHAERKTP
jgi:hypothetical protein